MLRRGRAAGLSRCPCRGTETALLSLRWSHWAGRASTGSLGRQGLHTQIQGQGEARKAALRARTSVRRGACVAASQASRPGRGTRAVRHGSRIQLDSGTGADTLEPTWRQMRRGPRDTCLAARPAGLRRGSQPRHRL